MIKAGWYISGSYWWKATVGMNVHQVRWSAVVLSGFSLIFVVILGAVLSLVFPWVRGLWWIQLQHFAARQLPL